MTKYHFIAGIADFVGHYVEGPAKFKKNQEIALKPIDIDHSKIANNQLVNVEDNLVFTVKDVKEIDDNHVIVECSFPGKKKSVFIRLAKVEG